MKPTSLVWRIVTLLVFAALAAFVVQRSLRPTSFGELGNYRLEGLYEIEEKTPVHQGKEACGECHDDVFETHQKDIHYDVQCEDCHGPGDVHIAYYSDDNKQASEEAAVMPKEYTLEGCLFCHRRLNSRPKDFPQIDLEKHYAFLHVKDTGTRCIECHSPHEPIFLLTKVEDARIHPVIFECESCHLEKPESDHRQVPDHPAIFVCQDCHPKIVEDFNGREHSFLRCTACHLFHRESDAAGRIFKNGNRRFCLLCHEKKPFKSEEDLPQVVSEEHLTEMAEFLEKDAKAVAEDPKACLECHLDYIHDSKLLGTGGKGNDEG